MTLQSISLVGKRRGAAILQAAVVLLATCVASPGRAEFTTIINSPPDIIGDTYIGSNTQINLYEGSVVPGSLFLGGRWTSNDNIEVNVAGGQIQGGLDTSIHPLAIDTNVVINVRSGVVEGRVRLDDGNEINVSGGFVGLQPWETHELREGSTARISGGEVRGGLSLDGGSRVVMTGGSVGGISAAGGSDVAISGGRITGGWYGSGGLEVSGGSTARISGGLIERSVGASYGSTVTISGGYVTADVLAYRDSKVNVHAGAVGPFSIEKSSQLNLTGGDFRINGVPIAGLSAPGSQTAITIPERGVLTGVLTDGLPIIVSQQGTYIDWLEGGLTLTSAAAPSALPQTFNLPGQAAPRALRAGQRLELRGGGVAPVNFRATWGSTMRIDGGEVGLRLRAAGTVIDMVDGRIGELAVMTMGSVLNVTGGEVGSNLNVASGSTVNVSGGSIGGLFQALPGSTARISGGVIHPGFQAFEDSRVTLVGSGFRINGTPVSGLGTTGATRQVEIPYGVTLSGTSADGRPFAFSTEMGDFFAPRALTLQAASPPASGPSVIRVPDDAAPRGLLAGQSLYLSDGGQLGDDFNANWGSVVNIDGGRFGARFEASGALVNIIGKAVGEGFTALYGTVANMAGDASVGWVQATRGSVINISGGEIAYGITVSNGGVVNVSGGAVRSPSVYGGSTLNVTGGRVDNYLSISERSAVNISGGQFAGPNYVTSDSAARISGGTFGDELLVDSASRIVLSGTDFRLNGDLVPDVPISGLSVPLVIPVGAVLSGTFEDGTPFAFSASDRDRFGVDSVRLLQTWNTPPQRAPTIDLPTGPAPVGVRAGQAFVVDAAHLLGDNFNAGWGSAVTMTSGAVGGNFEAVGAQILIAGGTVGPEFDAFHGSEVTITGGAIGEGFTAHAGSVVNITGGTFIDKITAIQGSVVNISGGHLSRWITAARGSTINITGSQFTMMGEPIPGLVLGTATQIDLADFAGLVGVLADGNPFGLEYDGYWPAGVPKPPAPIVTLTLVPDSDFDRDGLVTGWDLLAWQYELGDSAYGDADGDLDTDGADFLIWQRQLGTRRRVLEDPVAVPEPANLALTGVAVLGGLLSVRRRPRS